LSGERTTGESVSSVMRWLMERVIGVIQRPEGD
jgi:hypothetical protein